ncbi:hypothetical protein SPRG_20105 [Saprolegnia parasitica CBS 223.65]|uniref:Hexose transporter 1 n=1 Tax=Saprolegnia parasitica (strain CBS 223.65) TaxID=695850 RepID=A0A067CII4_SAPPC|nr:hypothetical protein SPRG_20105 [Saprolegnia parasitica CBS 223.65]KDO29000.1 hypothetical protein SPRG_20105 [Saprolegnia parasitica CBS 223.65]|eukprot:XP_012200329.1 hypothetical protein SPRG_20105 [Saprolegnia parasitica CBS 223.65]
MADKLATPFEKRDPSSTVNEDAYVAIRQSPKDDGGLSEPRASTSWRASRRSTSRVRLSRLESMMHEEHAAALIPMPILYVTIALNYRPFNVDCLKVPIPDQACIMFPGHSGNEWTMAVTAYDKFGRQRTLFLIAITMIIGGVLETVSSEIYLFSFGRVVSGIASGAAINVSNVLISEISPTQMRGMFSTGLQVGVAFGSLAVTTVHYFVGYGEGWRILVGFPIVLGIAQILLIPLTTKSPVWLVTHGQNDLALKELKRLYRPCNTEAILNAMIAAHEEEVKETEGVNAWAALFSKKYRKQLIIGMVLCSAQQLCGINAVMYYSSSIFFSAGVTDPRVGNTIVNVVRTTMILVAARIMDKFKRRTLLLLFMTLMAIASVGIIISLLVSSPILSVIATGMYVGAFCLSIGPMAWMVTGEIFPDFLHANSGAIGTMCTWVGNFLVGVFYPTISKEDSLGNYAFFIFVAFLVAYVVFIYFVVPETAQKTFDEIQKEFDIEPAHKNDDDEEAPKQDPWAS